MENASIKQVLDELQLIQCSLRPNEHMSFLEDAELWESALASHSEDPSVLISCGLKDMTIIGIHVDNAKIRFELTLNTKGVQPLISVKGEDISRKDQERWQSILADIVKKISDSEFAVYQLVSLHILPMLHEELEAVKARKSDSENPSNIMLHVHEDKLFHVLFTSHHLLSVSKRCSLQQWSSSLRLSGFAKVGYPGVIYAQGQQANVEEFVDNIKGMQWLALKLRFVEPLPGDGGNNTPSPSPMTWKEFQKVGEVVEEMRRLGREEFVVEMGIGSAGVNSKK